MNFPPHVPLSKISMETVLGKKKRTFHSKTNVTLETIFIFNSLFIYLPRTALLWILSSISYSVVALCRGGMITVTNNCFNVQMRCESCIKTKDGLVSAPLLCQLILLTRTTE